MKKVLLAAALTLAMAAPAFAVDFAFHGDFNNRLRPYTNQPSFFDGGRADDTQGIINEDDSNDFTAEIKYRLWTEATSDDGAIKGVFAVEFGGVRFGEGDAGDFSGDGTSVEVRWAYTDFALGDGRIKFGLQPFKANKFLWAETATGIDYSKPLGDGNLQLAWMRGYEVINTTDSNDFEDLDALFARYNFKAKDTKVGLFAMWQHSDGDDMDDLEAFFGRPVTEDDLPENYTKMLTDIDMDLFTFGVDGATEVGNFFINWDLMAQTGDLAEDADFGGYFAHFDVGTTIGSNGKLTYTFWYASGDDDSTDGDLDAYIATDTDINAEYSIVIFENFLDDDMFAETPYLMDKGMIFNRLGYTHQCTDKTKVDLGLMYIMTAEDIEYTDDNGDAQSNDEIGWEIDATVSHQLFSNTVVELQAGYLFADDALDFYEVEMDGDSDEDIFTTVARLRYKF